MKKLSALVVAVVIAMSVFVLGGCAPPALIEFDTFIAFSQESGFHLSFDGDNIATANINETAIVRLERHTDSRSAQHAFDYEFSRLENKYNVFVRSVSTTMSSHGSWRFNTGDNHYLIQWVDTNFIFAHGRVADRDAIEEFLFNVRHRSQ